MQGAKNGAVDHATGAILGQVSVGIKTNEIPRFEDLLNTNKNFAGIIFTADAFHTQRSLQRQLKELPWKDVPVGHKHSYKSHDRKGSRSIKGVTIDAGILFPHAAQDAQITRRSRRINGTKWSVETVYIITSLPAEKTSAEELNTMVRGHWTRENRLHWVRDVVFLEDKSMVRTGNAPRFMAAPLLNGSVRNLEAFPLPGPRVLKKDGPLVPYPSATTFVGLGDAVESGPSRDHELRVLR